MIIRLLILISIILNPCISNARPPMQYDRIIKEYEESLHKAYIQYKYSVNIPIENVEWQAAIDAVGLLEDTYHRHYLIHKKAKEKEARFMCTWAGCPITDTYQDSKNAIALWGTLMGRTLVQLQLAKVDEANNSKTPREELARALRVLLWAEAELHYARYFKKQVYRTFKTNIFNWDADNVVKEAAIDVDITRKAYEKQKAIVKTREVDEEALVVLNYNLNKAKNIKQNRLNKLTDYDDTIGLDSVYEWFMAIVNIDTL